MLILVTFDNLMATLQHFDVNLGYNPLSGGHPITDFVMILVRFNILVTTLQQFDANLGHIQ